MILTDGGKLTVDAGSIRDMNGGLTVDGSGVLEMRNGSTAFGSIEILLYEMSNDSSFFKLPMLAGNSLSLLWLM